MKIAFDGQFFLKGNKTGVAWSADNIIRNMAHWKNISRQIQCFGLGYSRRQKEQVYKYEEGNCTVNMCRWFHDVVYRMIWNYIPIPYSVFFGKSADVSIFFNFIIPPGVKGKKIAVIHDMAYMACPDTVRSKTRRVLETSMRKSCRRADKIITISEFSKSEILKYLPVESDKVEVVPWGVDFNVYNDKYSADIIGQTVKKYIAEEEYILYLGTIEPRKNLERLIYAYAMLYDKENNIPVLALAGQKGWYYDEIFNAVKELQLESKVKFLGYVPDEDVLLLLCGAKVFVFPSLYEGFGLPPLEAMACGTPVVTSNVASLPEFTKDVAILVDPMSVSSIADGIDMALRDECLREKIIEKGLNRSREYTWDRSTERIVDICRQLMQEQQESNL